MGHIKKLVMSGFKSFARRTEILFDPGVNVILGPNGSGKSNIAEALCFVLGRLSIKSIRAAKSTNLLFVGSKYIKPGKEAIVELVFDNSDRAFSLDRDEVHLARIVRRNGQGIYKINGETKTRLEVIEMLARAGIDPHGFNLILQGQIQSIVRMHPEERRKIIEEVAGISIYETRKEKSLHELEKTEEKLKEISAILRERSSFLKNLENERAQALRFKELELTVKRCKASLLSKKRDEKQKELFSIASSIEEKLKQKDKMKSQSDRLQQNIELLAQEIQQIHKNIQQATGLEQETLHNSIANLKAEIEGLRVRQEHYGHRHSEIERRLEEMQKSVPELEQEINELRQESPKIAKKAQGLRRKKEALAVIEEERNKLLLAKSELHAIRELQREKDKQIARVLAESEALVQQLEKIGRKLFYQNIESGKKSVLEFKNSFKIKEEETESLSREILKHEKLIALAEANIENANGIKVKVKELDICPLCQSTISTEHINHVISDAEKKILSSEKILSESRTAIQQLQKSHNFILQEIKNLQEGIMRGEEEIITHRTLEEKNEQLKKLMEYEQALRKELRVFDEKRKLMELKTQELPRVQEHYDTTMLEIEEISSRTEEDIETTLLYKERELENVQTVIKRGKKDLDEIKGQMHDMLSNLKSKEKGLAKKEEQERELNERFKKMFEQRDILQKDLQDKSLDHTEIQHVMKDVEEQINYFKIGKAKLDAEREAISMELQDYAGIEILQGSASIIEERMKKAQDTIQNIGSINLRALEVYEGVKKSYDEVQEKVNTLDKEKQEILNIINEIDHKKIRSFLKTFNSMNALFSENYAKLSSKGAASLELENKKDIFSGGMSIAVKLAKGKYFDVSSLSGGEQTLVALSLLFAIQEYKPYHFYIFDEIDAALDKRNSERLAALLNQYMKSGQYIVITHNDAIILNSNVLYGVSMHDGVSKILSLKIDNLPMQSVPEVLTSLSTPLNPGAGTLSSEVQELEQKTDIIRDRENLEHGS